MSKYLVINEMCNDYFFPYINSENVDLARFYKSTKYENSTTYNILRRLGVNILSKTNLDKAGKKYGAVLFFDCSCGAYKFRQIRKDHSISKILFIWNPMDYYLDRLNTRYDHYTIDDLKRTFDKIYYFDKSECQKYGVEYFPTVYSRSVPAQFSISNNQEILFMGSKKNRGEIVKKYNDIFRANELKTDIYVSSDVDEEQDGIHYFEGRKKYSWYLEKVSKCGAILDIPQKGQNGFTQRVMEALFFGKKLITTNQAIIDYDIYNPNNVFILGVDKTCDLHNFMSTPYIKMGDDILDEYDFDTWIRNIMTK